MFQDDTLYKLTDLLTITSMELHIDSDKSLKAASWHRTIFNVDEAFGFLVLVDHPRLQFVKDYLAQHKPPSTLLLITCS